MQSELWPWAAILLLGAWHGVNPGMGWLFAVALGMQERRGGAVVGAMLPLAVGHGLAVLAAVVVAMVVGVVVPRTVLQWVVALTLVAVGVSRLVRHRHPRYGGMKVTRAQLAIWSMLMASAHGAGMMVVPLVLRIRAGDIAAADISAGHGAHVGHVAHGEHALQFASMLPGLGEGALSALAATVAHTGGYLLVTAALAGLVYWKLGVQVLRRLWVNLDLVWGVALIVTGVVTVWM